MNKPKPAAVRRAMGNPGKRPIPEVRDVDTGPAVMPAYVNRRKRAVALWNEYAPALELLGTLKAESAGMFGVWCMLMAEFERNPNRMPASKIAQIRFLSSSLGMDPSTRGKFSTPKPNANQDPAEEFFTGPRAVIG